MSISGTVHVPGVGVEKAAYEIERALAEARAPAARSHNRIVFRRGAWKWGLTNIERITGGVAEVTQVGDGVAVTYRVTLTHTVWLVTGVLALFGVALVLQEKESVLPALLLMWLWPVGVLYLDTAVSFPAFLADAAVRSAAVARKRAPRN